VLRGEELGMVSVERVRLVVALLLAEAEEAVHLRVGVRAVLPLARGPPLELRGLGRPGEGLLGIEQRLDVDAVVDRGIDRSHVPLLGPPTCGASARVQSAPEGRRYTSVGRK